MTFTQSYIWPTDFQVIPVPSSSETVMYQVLVQHNLNVLYPVIEFWSDGIIQTPSSQAATVRSIDENSVALEITQQADDFSQIATRTITLRLVA